MSNVVKLNIEGNNYTFRPWFKCSTAADQQFKYITVPNDFSIVEGATIIVYFVHGNTFETRLESVPDSTEYQWEFSYLNFVRENGTVLGVYPIGNSANGNNIGISRLPIIPGGQWCEFVCSYESGGSMDQGMYTFNYIGPALVSETNDGLMTIADKQMLNDHEDRLVSLEGLTENEIIEWNENSNMDDFKTPGVYDIYGERKNIYDNLPITNAAPGHSISAKLTIIASTLQPDNTEICVTQFLQLSNRLGREGASYIRTYNENNGTADGWTPWQKQQGIIETQFNSDVFTGVVIDQTPILNHYYKMTGKTEKYGGGLNGMIDNGMYSGLYTDAIQSIYDPTTGFAGYGLNMRTLSMGSSNMMETFVLIVLNDYSAAKLLGSDRHISQLKYAIHAGTGECTIKKRVGTGGDTIVWTEWEDISGVSNSFEDVVKDISITEITDTDATNRSFAITPLDESGIIGINAIFAGLDSGERYDGLVKASDVRQYVENKIAAAIGGSGGMTAEERQMLDNHEAKLARFNNYCIQVGGESIENEVLSEPRGAIVFGDSDNTNLWDGPVDLSQCYVAIAEQNAAGVDESYDDDNLTIKSINGLYLLTDGAWVPKYTYSYDSAYRNPEAWDLLIGQERIVSLIDEAVTEATDELKDKIDLLNARILDIKLTLESLTDRDWTKDMNGNDTDIWA